MVFALPSCTPAETQPVATSLPEDTATAISTPFDPKAETALRHYFDSLAQKGAFSGVALFARDGSVFSMARGLREYPKGQPIEVSDQFQLASVSKPFTAYATLMLVQQGRIKLDALVSDYITPFPYAGVTVHHLLTHTSGIGNYAYITDSLWGYPEWFMSNDDFGTMLACHDVPEYHHPAKTFDYCNTNYALLANIIAQVSGVPFHQFMRDSVFTPLGMANAEIMNVFAKNPLGYAVQGHYPEGAQKKPFYLDGVVGDKGMYATAADIYTFYRATRAGVLLSDTLFAEAIAPKTRYDRNQFYGYGWRIRSLPDGDTLLYHNGWWRGFRTYFWTSKSHDKCAIVLTNTTRGRYLSQDEIWSRF